MASVMSLRDLENQIVYQTKVTRETFEFQDFQLTLEVRSLESLDDTIDRVFEYLQENGNESELERLCPYFGVVWPAARALADALFEEASRREATKLSGLKILEIGCGLALPSLVAAKLGAQILATDYHPMVPRFLNANLELNQISTIEYLELDWGSESDETQKKLESITGTDWDLIIGSDILYERFHASQLFSLFEKILTQTKRSNLIWITDPARPYLQAFIDHLKASSISVKTDIRTTFEWIHGQKKAKDIFILKL